LMSTLYALCFLRKLYAIMLGYKYLCTKDFAASLDCIAFCMLFQTRKGP
jgi:hypothetical protein